MKWLMITKNLAMKIPNLVVSHESRPVKSKPDLQILMFITTFTKRLQHRKKNIIVRTAF